MKDVTAQFVSFEVDGRLFGLDIRIVKEVNPNTAITPVPRSARHLRGLVNIRGQVVLVIDIAVIFGKPERPTAPSSQVIILKTAQEVLHSRHRDSRIDPTRYQDKAVGFLVDRIGDVVSVETGAFCPAPPHLAASIAPFVSGVVRLVDGLLVVLDPVELLGFNGAAGADGTSNQPETRLISTKG